MGYTTEFRGRFELDKPLTYEHSNILSGISDVYWGDAEHDTPGGYCQWIVSADKKGLEWDGEEKFYNYVEWIEHLIYAYLANWGYTVNGVVRWRGEDFDDMGKITVVNNTVTTSVIGE